MGNKEVRSRTLRHYSRGSSEMHKANLISWLHFYKKNEGGCSQDKTRCLQLIEGMRPLSTRICVIKVNLICFYSLLSDVRSQRVYTEKNKSLPQQNNHFLSFWYISFQASSYAYFYNMYSTLFPTFSFITWALFLIIKNAFNSWK